MLHTPNWLEWYRTHHQQECFKSGVAFEDYATRVLHYHHPDFNNPAPAGQLGDGGCDGLADQGETFYACYGQRPDRNAERELQRKLEADFNRALEQWPAFVRWRFVTNARPGPQTLSTYTELQRRHGQNAERPLTLEIWTPDDLWSQVVRKLPEQELDELFPGVPGVQHVELADLLPLLDSLDPVPADDGPDIHVRPVPQDKMDFNALSAAAQFEFNEGRLASPQIDTWYSVEANPGLADAHGAQFSQIYNRAKMHTDQPGEILERVYVAVAGENFRMDAQRASAAYAVVSYFFDRCHIFEAPTHNAEVTDAAAN
ncbi:MAG: ABC-three component system protein [Dehalococcoidia bacterium]